MQPCTHKWLATLIAAAIFWTGWTALDSSPALAAGPITVTTTADETTINGLCSLREAVEAANTDTAVDACPAGSGADTIVLLPGLYNIYGSGGSIDLTSTLTITSTAGAAYTTIGGMGNTRLFFVTSSGVVTISNLTLTLGEVLSGNGGAIWNSGVLLVNQSVISSSHARDGHGGAIFNSSAVLTVTNSALVNNTAGFDGGAIYNNGGTVVMTNTTVSGNRADENGGGLGNDNTMHLYNVTVANNTADYDNLGSGDGGGIYASGTTDTIIKNSIVANNTDASTGGGPVHPDCSGVLNSYGYNLLEDLTGCIWGGTTGDITGQDPKLAALADNGGGTYTHALSAGSPALDAGTNTACPTTDQRGVARPIDGDNDSTATCDMGAYEAERVSLSSVQISGPTSGVAGASYSFTATAGPVTATLPITYVWQADGQSTITHSARSSLTDTVTFNWPSGGSKVITVTAVNFGTPVSDTHTITLAAVPYLTIGKSGPASVNAADHITYTLTVTNSGGADASNLVITDTLPTGGSFMQALDGGQLVGGQTVSWTVASLTAGNSTAVRFVVAPAKPTVVNSDYRVSASGGYSATGSVVVTTTVSGGATINVNTLTDELNSDGDCSLREAVQAANTNSQVDACTAGINADTIVLPPGTYTLNSGLGQINLTSTLTITPTGSLTNTIIDGGGSTQLFDVSSSGVVTLTNLTLQNGNATSFNGGAVWNSGALLVDRTVITGSTGANGGAIFNSSAVLTVTNSALVNNTAAEFSGGAIANNGGTVVMTNTTVSGNRAKMNGGGLANDNAISLYNVTVANNTADYDGNNDGNGGGIFHDDNFYAFNVKNTIIANNTDASSGGSATVHPDCSVANTVGIQSLGYSLLEDNTGCTWNSGTGDVTGQDPKLAALADNGGGTWTHALSTNSPALDAGTNTACPATDQRGVARPIDGDGNGTATCDMGAYEAPTTEGGSNNVYLPVVLKNF